LKEFTMIPSKPAKPSSPQTESIGSDTGIEKGSATNPAKGQMGEGSYEGTRDYQKSIKDYLKEADVQRDARNAKPSSAAEAAELVRAEKEGKSHSRASGE